MPQPSIHGSICGTILAVSETRWRKVWERIGEHPRSVSYEDLKHRLTLAGFDLVRSSGSHHTFQRGSETVTVPYRRPHVLPVYVKDVLARTAPPEEPE